MNPERSEPMSYRTYCILKELRERFFSGEIDKKELVEEVESVMRMKQMFLEFEKGGEQHGA